MMAASSSSSPSAPSTYLEALSSSSMASSASTSNVISSPMRQLMAPATLPVLLMVDTGDMGVRFEYAQVAVGEDDELSVEDLVVLKGPDWVAATEKMCVRVVEWGAASFDWKWWGSIWADS